MSVDWQAARRALARRLLRPSAVPAADTAIAARGITSVLVARPNHRLGNVLLLTPLLQELERLLPQARVDVLAGPPFAACLLEGYPMVRRVDTLSARPLHQPSALWRLWRELPRRGYTLALDAAERSQSARWVVTRSAARWRVGMDDAPDASGLTQAIAFADCGVHQAQMPVRMLRAALGHDLAAAPPPLALRLRDAERAQGRARLQRLLGEAAPAAPRIGLFAEATGAKRFAHAFWQALAAALRARAAQARLAEIVPAHGRPLLPELPGIHTAPLRDAAALCAGFDLVIAADSGLMHLAAASGVPLLGLFQATDPARYAPYGVRQCGLQARSLSVAEIAGAALALIDPA
jgi:ADP-heptose:LPS heptosyltransferase